MEAERWLLGNTHTDRGRNKLRICALISVCLMWRAGYKARKKERWVTLLIWVHQKEKGGECEGRRDKTWIILLFFPKNAHSKSLSKFSIRAAHMQRIDLWQPSREGRVVVRDRTWHRACVGGQIERQRPMRKGKKIKRGRKGKHLGVLDILSAPNTHLRHGKTPWMGFTIPPKKWREPVRAGDISDCVWEQRSNGGWIKAWKQYPVPCVSESQIHSGNTSSFLFFKMLLRCLTQDRGTGSEGGDKTNRN